MNLSIIKNFEMAKKISIGYLKKNEGYLVDSTLGIIAKKLLAQGFNLYKTNHRYYGSKFF